MIRGERGQMKEWKHHRPECRVISSCIYFSSWIFLFAFSGSTFALLLFSRLFFSPGCLSAVKRNLSPIPPRDYSKQSMVNNLVMEFKRMTVEGHCRLLFRVTIKVLTYKSPFRTEWQSCSHIPQRHSRPMMNLPSTVQQHRQHCIITWYFLLPVRYSKVL